jgi:hypothetical protein
MDCFLKGLRDEIPSWKKKSDEPAFKVQDKRVDDERLKKILSLAGATDVRDAPALKSARSKSIFAALQPRSRDSSRNSDSSASPSAICGDGEEGLGISAFENALSVRTIKTFWDAKVGLQPNSYERMYEQNVGLPYPFPQITSAPEPSEASLPTVFQDTVARALTATKSRLATLAIPDSMRVASFRFGRSTNKPTSALDSAPIEQGTNHVARDYADSILPSQAFSNGDWSTTASLNKSFSPYIPESELQENEKESLNDDARYKTSQLSNADSASSSIQSVAAKFAAQEVMEANMLRSSMRQAGVHQAIVDVVAVSQEQLSEML